MTDERRAGRPLWSLVIHRLVLTSSYALRQTQYPNTALSSLAPLIIYVIANLHSHFFNHPTLFSWTNRMSRLGGGVGWVHQRGTPIGAFDWLMFVFLYKTSYQLSPKWLKLCTLYWFELLPSGLGGRSIHFCFHCSSDKRAKSPFLSLCEHCSCSNSAWSLHLYLICKKLATRYGLIEGE